MTQPIDESTDESDDGTNERVRAVLARLDAARQGRASWWRDAEQRDADAVQRDDRGDRRDARADARDEVARRRDTDALLREQAAADLAVGAHGRLDAQDTLDVDLVVAHTEAVADLARVFAELRRLPGAPAAAVDRARAALELHLDRACAAVYSVGIERDQVRQDLRTIAAHLDAGTAERLSAGDDRADAATERNAAQADRNRARADRQAAAVDRAH